MTDVPSDELISAYLDGELSGEELARAEQMLATHPESRQLLEELTALRASLQGLPRRALEPGFGDRVLRRAEREMLQPAAAARRQSDTYGPHTLLSWQRWRRPLAWSAAAVAAGLLVMILSPEDQKVAVAPAPPGGELHATPAAPALAKKDWDSTGAQPSEQAAGGAGPSATPMPLEAPAADIALMTTEKQQAVDPAALFDTSDDRLVVVRCDVTGRAEAETVLRGLLASNQIVWESADRKTESIEGRDKQTNADQAESTEARLKNGQLAETGPRDSDAVLVQAESQQLQTAINTLTTTRSFRNIRFERVDAPAEKLEGDEALSRLTARLKTVPPAPAEEPTANKAPATQQRQQGTAVQLPYTEAQNLMRAQNVAEDRADSAHSAGTVEAQRDAAVAAQNAPQSAADASAPQAGQTRPLPRQPARMAAPATAAKETLQQQSQEAAPSQMSRALIILHVAPEAPAEHEPSPATP